MQLLTARTASAAGVSRPSVSKRVPTRRGLECRADCCCFMPAQHSKLTLPVVGLDLVHAVVARSTLSKCSSDLCLLLARGLEDPFPDAKKAAAAGLAALAQKLPQGALEDSAERLVQVCCAVPRCAVPCWLLCASVLRRVLVWAWSVPCFRALYLRVRSGCLPPR